MVKLIIIWLISNRLKVIIRNNTNNLLSEIQKMYSLVATSIVISVMTLYSITAYNDNCESVCDDNEDCLRVCSEPLIASKTSPISDQSCGISSFDSRRANKDLGRILSGEHAGHHKYPWFASLQVSSDTDRQDYNNVTSGINIHETRQREQGGGRGYFEIPPPWPENFGKYLPWRI